MESTGTRASTSKIRGTARKWRHYLDALGERWRVEVDVHVKDAICESEVPSLDILACGPLPANPADLRHTEGSRQFLARCRGSLDRVAQDGPPLAPVTAPAIIGGATDGPLLVPRPGHSTREPAQFARRQLGDTGAGPFGPLINRTDRKGYGCYAPCRRNYRITS
jgi:Mrp family chromosome partitioning ATPase